MGRLTVFYGCMFSEKSGDMISICLKAQKYQGKKVIFFKPSVDSRSSAEVVSRIGLSAKATIIDINAAELCKELKEKFSLGGQFLKEIDIIAFDEVQFFSKEIVNLVKMLLDCGFDVMAAGLNLDYMQHPIGSVSELVMIADEAIKKTAYCSCCGEPALFSQRIINGKAYLEPSNGMVVIGDKESYEPRCRKHYIPPKNKKAANN